MLWVPTPAALGSNTPFKGSVIPLPDQYPPLGVPISGTGPDVTHKLFIYPIDALTLLITVIWSEYESGQFPAIE